MTLIRSACDPDSTKNDSDTSLPRWQWFNLGSVNPLGVQPWNVFSKQCSL